MNTAILIQLARIVSPMLLAALLAAAILLLIKPAARRSFFWLFPFAIAIAAFVGNAIANDRLFNLSGASQWLGIYTAAALALPFVRSTAEDPPRHWPITRALLFALLGWALLRHLPEFRNTSLLEQFAPLAAVAFFGSIISAPLEHTAATAEPRRAFWLPSATILILATAFSQVIIIGAQVQNAAFIAAGIAAAAGVALAVAIIFRVNLITPAAAASASAALTTLLLFAAIFGWSDAIPIGLYALLLTAASAAPVFAGLLLGERFPAWASLALTALFSCAAVAAAATITPPFE